MANLTNLNNKFLVTTGGNVGIGTTSPSTKLEVLSSQTNSSIRTGGLEMQSYAVNNSWYAENLYYDGAWKLRSNGYATQMYMEAGVISFKRVASGSAGDSVSPLTTMVLDSSGNVSLNGGLLGLGNAASTPNIGYGMFHYNGVGLGIYSSASGATQGIGFWLNNGSAYEAGRFLSNGNLGIGTTSPAKKLEVATTGINQSSTIRIQGTDGNGNGHPLDLKMNGADDSFSILIGQGGGATPSTILFNGNRNGNVGIGTSSPSSRLVVRTSTDHNFEVEETGGELRLSALNDARSANIGLQFAASEFNFITGNVGIGTTSPNKTLTVYGGNDNGIWIDSQGGQYTSLAFGHNGTEKANIAWDNTNGYTNISTYGNGHLALTTGGSIKAFLNYNGNFGIGTTSPDFALDIEASGSGVQLQIGRTSSNVGSTWMGSDSNGFHLGVGTYGSGNSVSDPNGFTVNTSGKLGIGTASPDKRLTVGGVNATEGINLKTKSGSNVWTIWSVEQYFSQEGYMRLFYDNVSKIQFRADGDSFFNGGNVGIGVTSPAAVLDIYSPYDVTSNPNSTGIRLRRVAGGSQSYLVGMGVSGVSNDYFVIRDITNGAYRFVITDDGRVGIGTTAIPNPFNAAYSSILQVGTDSGNTRLVITAGSTSSSDLNFADANNTGVGSYVGAISYKHNGDYMLFSTNGSEKMRITSTGAVGIGTTAPRAKLEVNGELIAQDIKHSNYSVGSLNTTGVTVATITGAGNGSSAQIEFIGMGGTSGIVDVVYSCTNQGGNWYAYKKARQTPTIVDVDVTGHGTATLSFVFKALSSSGAAYTPRLMMKGSPSALVTF